MQKQVKYKFKELPLDAKKHVRLFQVHEFLNWGGLGVFLVIMVLMLLERGFNLFDIAILMGVFSATTLIFELPLGGLADGIGRKPVFIASIFANLGSILILLYFQSYLFTALSFSLFGLGRALTSGTMDAWYIEVFRRLAPKFGTVPILAKAQFASAFGLAIGAVSGGFMADYFGPLFLANGYGVFDAPLFGALAIGIVVLLFNIFLIKEDRHPINRASIKAGFASVPEVIKNSYHYAVAHEIISILLASVGLISMALFALETFWIPFAKPMIDSQYAVSFIGIVSSIYFFSFALGTAFAEPVVALFKGQTAKALAFLVILSGLVFIGISMTTNIYVFVVVLIALNAFVGAQGAPGESIFHDYVPDDKRSTLLSLQSVIGQLGGLIGMLSLGYVAEIYGISTAWKIGGVIVIIAGIILFVLPKRMANTPVVSHEKVDDEG